jgi:DUF2946 family protein
MEHAVRLRCSILTALRDPFMRLTSPRRRFTLLAAFVAALLNMLAPVLAYDVAQQRAHHHAVHDVHAMHHDADPDEPAAPHCPYCLDFAAGAALAPTLPPPAIVRPEAVAYSASVRAQPASRSSLRLASPRAPPLAA